MNLPGVSIIIPVLNTERTIKECLESISSQDYPKNKIEVLILDGGSTDQTLNIIKPFVKRLNVKIIAAGFRDNMEARRMVGFQKSKFGLVCILDSDNYLGSKDWISKLVQPLVDHSELVGSFTLHYHYDPNQTIFNRYVALFGGHDPVSYYLGKTDRLKWTDKTWTRKHQIVLEHSDYTIVKFDVLDFPTLGSNGTIIRKKFVDLKNLTPELFFHTDILFDQLSHEHNTYAVVDVPIVHDTSSSLFQNIRKRVEYMSLHHLKLIKHRRYKVFDGNSPNDVFNLLKFIFYTLTIVEPTGESVKGFIKVPDLAWFLHPIACWYFLIGYSYSVFNSKL
jgi:glycosyltransferase involved in cell wall biosynthesis